MVRGFQTRGSYLYFTFEGSTFLIVITPVREVNVSFILVTLTPYINDTIKKIYIRLD